MTIFIEPFSWRALTGILLYSECTKMPMLLKGAVAMTAVRCLSKQWMYTTVYLGGCLQGVSLGFPKGPRYCYGAYFPKS